MKTVDGLYLTNENDHFVFLHAKPAESPDLSQLQSGLARLANHKYQTEDHRLLQKIRQASTTLVTFNVQSLPSHLKCITTDTVMTESNILCLTETRVPNSILLELD